MIKKVIVSVAAVFLLSTLVLAEGNAINPPSPTEKAKGAEIKIDLSAVNIFEAVKNKDLKIAEAYIYNNRAKMDLNAKNEDQQSLLYIAAANQDEPMAALLLETGALPATDPNCLAEAVKNGNAKIAEMLLNRGADPNGNFASGSFNGSLLAEAVETQKKEIAWSLARHKAEPNIDCLAGLTYLGSAMKNKDPKKVQLWLSVGARKIHLKDDAAALQILIDYDGISRSMAGPMKKFEIDPNKKNADGISCVDYARSLENPKRKEKLLKALGIEN